mmetsp:Transcript_21017/g.66970  ORF Transcript_21017/g.66970 Transcript_21017/m.66970 type:complete len:216 (-) Transcript_21017:15-662(-)
MRGTLTTTAQRSSSCTSTAAPSWTWTSPSGSVAPSVRTTRAARTKRSSTRARLSRRGSGRWPSSSSRRRCARWCSSSRRRGRGGPHSQPTCPRRRSRCSVSMLGTTRRGPRQRQCHCRRADKPSTPSPPPPPPPLPPELEGGGGGGGECASDSCKLLARLQSRSPASAERLMPLRSPQSCEGACEGGWPPLALPPSAKGRRDGSLGGGAEGDGRS